MSTHAACQSSSRVPVSNDLNKAGATVTYPAPTMVGNVGTVSCAPSSGTFFSLGTTTVTCTATDQAGNKTKASFTVTVIPTTQCLLTQLRGSTVTLVTNTTVERSLLATLDKAQQYVNAGNKLMAYMTMLQFVTQIDQFQNSRQVSATVAQRLLNQAQQLTRSVL